jgi:hypothetical protein
MRPSAALDAFGVVRPKNGGLQMFLSLMHSCSQIRAEYRPLWLLNSKPRLEPRHLSSYFRTFYPTTQDLQHAPHELQISWHHSVDSRPDREVDVTPLLKMRVHRTDFRIRVVSQKLAENLLRDLVKLHYWQCESCEEGGRAVQEDHWDSFECESPHCSCSAPPESFHAEWADDCQVEMSNTKAFQALINHDNEEWLNDIREGKLGVHCSPRRGRKRRHKWQVTVDFPKSAVPQELSKRKRIGIEGQWLVFVGKSSRNLSFAPSSSVSVAGMAQGSNTHRY